jgi:hypothetical protein
VPVEIAAMILTSLLATGSVPTDAPEVEMLEFLGGFETADGQWLDPLVLDEQTRDPPPASEEDQP